MHAVVCRSRSSCWERFFKSSTTLHASTPLILARITLERLLRSCCCEENLVYSSAVSKLRALAVKNMTFEKHHVMNTSRWLLRFRCYSICFQSLRLAFVHWVESAILWCNISPLDVNKQLDLPPLPPLPPCILDPVSSTHSTLPLPTVSIGGGYISCPLHG